VLFCFFHSVDQAQSTSSQIVDYCYEIFEHFFFIQMDWTMPGDHRPRDCPVSSQTQVLSSAKSISSSESCFIIHDAQLMNA